MNASYRAFGLTALMALATACNSGLPSAPAPPEGPTPPEASFGLPPGREAGLSNFSTMGIVDVDFVPKPAFAVWQDIFDRPLR